MLKKTLFSEQLLINGGVASQEFATTLLPVDELPSRSGN